MGIIRRIMTPVMDGLFRGFYKRDVTYTKQYPTFSTNFEPKLINNPLYSQYTKFMQIEQDRLKAYLDYERMDNDIIAAALDLMADDSTQIDLEQEDPFNILCDDPKIKSILQDLYFTKLNIEEHLWDIARSFAKYGDFFVRVYGDKQQGIEYVDYSYHPSRISRVDKRGVIKGFILDNKTNLAPWQIVHFKLPGSLYRQTIEEMSTSPSDQDSDVSSDYGTSALYRSRKVWRQISCLEDSVIMSRLTKSLRRYIFQINTDGLNEKQALEVIDNITALLKKYRSFSETNMNSWNSAILSSQDEDIVLPVNGQKGLLGIQTLGGDGDVSNIADLDYYNNKLFGSLKVPKSFLGFEEALNGRNTLRMLDVRYARTIKVIQRSLVLGLQRLGYIHLSLLTKDPLAVPFAIRLPYISTIEEGERMEAFQTKTQALQNIVDLFSRIDADFNIVKKRNLLHYLMKEELKWDEATISKILDDVEQQSRIGNRRTPSFTDSDMNDKIKQESEDTPDSSPEAGEFGEPNDSSLDTSDEE